MDDAPAETAGAEQKHNESAAHSDAPATVSTASPNKASGSPTGKHKASSPSKRTNKLTEDPNATLAAISAKLATVIPPAESEIARINREALAAVSKRYQEQLARTKARDLQDAAQQLRVDQADNDYPPAILFDASLSSSPAKGSSIPTALHESIIAEEWVNVHLETNGTFLLPATDIQPLLQKTSAALGNDELDDGDDAAFAFRKRGVDSGPLGRAGIDRASLYRLGMPKDLVDRLYRALYVYTNGFHNIINEIASHCPPAAEKHVSSNVWLTFLLLLEQCENGKYEMAMLKFKHATQVWRQQMTEEFAAEKARLEAQVHTTMASLTDEALRSAEKSDVIAKLAADVVAANQTISTQHNEVVSQAEQIRLLKLELLVHEDDARKLNNELDDARKDFEVANSERINALAERFALDEELRKMQSELERIEAEKANYAKRMHEGLFMNQALRATNESLKQHSVVLVMEKDRVASERDGLYAQISTLHDEVQALKLAKAQVEKDLVDAQRKHEHLAARIESMKEQFAIEVATTSKHVQHLAVLQSELDEEKVKVGVLEAKCSLLTAEKQNTGMRAQDKLRIERLLNQKLELENTVEALKLERTKDQEQIWNLRASLEALDTEMQHSKRVFSAGQQAFLHSERTCEQLRSQLQDVEKSYEKASKNLTSLKERFKIFEESSKDQITKLEVELKVTNAQLREVSYANRDNTAVIAELNKSLEVSSKELKSMKTRLDASEQSFAQLKHEKEDLQREQTQRELQRSTSRNAIEAFIRALQHILTLVKLDEYPFDEALRELLRLTHETFGHEIDLERVLDDEDEAEEFEEELDDDDVLDAQRTRRKLRKQGLLIADDASAESVRAGAATAGVDGDGDTDESSPRRRTQVTSMSKFRKSKLDKLVKKLERDAANKSDLIASLEGVVCEQADHVAQLTRANELQDELLARRANQIAMLNADLDATWIALRDVRAARRRAVADMHQAELDRDAEIRRALDMQHALEGLRRAFDRQSTANEDLLSRIWREYEHYLLMLSLRRDKEVQATVEIAEHESQTLVPQRNPATERPRIASMYLPAPNPMAETFEDVIQQINRNAKVLLPEAVLDISLPHGGVSTGAGTGLYSQVPVVHPAHRSGIAATANARRTRRETDPHRGSAKRYERTCGKQARLTQQALGLPAIEQQQATRAAHPPHIIRHVNEFGTRQDVLISPVYPPYFSDSKPTAPPPHAKTPRKPEQPQHRRYYQHRQPGAVDNASDERCSSPSALPSDLQRRSPRAGKRREKRRADAVPGLETSAERSGDTGLRYHRGFLRTGMEVLRGAARGFPEDDDNEDDDIDDIDDNDGDDSERESEGSVALSPRSPGRLEEAIRGYQRELGAQAHGAHQRRLLASEKDELVRAAASVRTASERDDGHSRDAELVHELSSSRFVPAVLYPLLPTQQQ